MDEHPRAPELHGAGASPALSAIEIYEPDGGGARHRGRSLVRMRAREFVPVSGQDLILPDMSHRLDGVFWGLRAPDDVTVTLSATTHRTVAAAVSEAEDLVVTAYELVAVPVRHPATGHHSLWFARDGRVVLVAARRWRFPAGMLAPRILRMLTLAALSA